MYIWVNVTPMIFLAGLVIASFLCMLLLLKQRKAQSDRILLIWMAIMSVHILLFYLYHQGVSFQYPHTLGLLLPLPVVHGVLLYFYTRSLTAGKAHFSRKAILHWVPFLLLILLAVPFYILPAEAKVVVYQNKGAGYEWYMIIQRLTILLCGFGYSAAVIYIIHHHRQKMQAWFSNTDRLKLRWLEYLAYGLGGIWFLTIFFDDSIIFMGVSIFVLFIGFFGINQVPVFMGNYVEHKTAISESQTSAPRYEKTGLKSDEAEALFDRLEQLMNESQPFRDSDLTLQDLAARLGVAPNQLSQAINSQSGKAFYHYVNEKRLDAFLKLAALPSSRKFTFLALAHDCGFNSKTTFNKYFKQHTGKTPSEYLSVEEAV